VAVPGDEIRVGQGTYYPDHGDYGHAVEDGCGSFQLLSGVALAECFPRL
jgi:hypothetical protein